MVYTHSHCNKVAHRLIALLVCQLRLNDCAPSDTVTLMFPNVSLHMHVVNKTPTLAYSILLLQLNRYLREVYTFIMSLDGSLRETTSRLYKKKKKKI